MVSDFEHIAECKAVSIFWITATTARARRVAALQACGAITRNFKSELDKFPTCFFRVDKKKFESAVPSLCNYTGTLVPPRRTNL